MHDDPMHVRRALQAGAAGYATKNARPNEIIEAVRRVARGGTYVEHSIAEELVFLSIKPQTHLLAELSTRELEVLRLLAKGCSLSTIASTIAISRKTAANSSSRIKAKLGARTTADLISIAFRSGLVDREAERSQIFGRRQVRLAMGGARKSRRTGDHLACSGRRAGRYAGCGLPHWSSHRTSPACSSTGRRSGRCRSPCPLRSARPTSRAGCRLPDCGRRRGGCWCSRE